MAHIAPAERSAEPGLAGVFAAVEGSMGFLPNSMLTMAHMPQLPMAFMMLTSVVFGADLKSLMAAFADSVPEQGDAGNNLGSTTVHLKGANRSGQYRNMRLQTTKSGFDVPEFFKADVGGKTGFGDVIVK